MHRHIAYVRLLLLVDRGSGRPTPMSRLSCSAACLYTRINGRKTLVRTTREAPHETMAHRARRAALPTGICAAVGARDPVRLCAERAEAAARQASRRGRRRRPQLQETHIRLFTRR